MLDPKRSKTYGLRIEVNLHALQVLQNCLLKLFLLLLRVGVIESDDELATILLGVVVIQESSLSVADMKETE